MTSKEAILFFPLEKGDDINDVFEDQLFEYKQFFISKFPIGKVFISKLIKMNQMYEAFIMLGGKEKNKDFAQNYIQPTFTNNIKQTFHEYQQIRNLIKSNILRAESPIEIEFIVHYLLEIQKKYSLKWNSVNIICEEEVIISKEPDPMLLLAAIDEFNQLGGFTFDDINLKRNILPKALLLESKRLSLYPIIEN